jgi:GT2 family glycosyltransferase
VRASVIIPSGNGRPHLPLCLAALRRQSFRDFEVVLVDNNSADDSLPFVRREFPEVRIVALPYNGVFAGAVNAGLRRASGEIAVLLNNDTEAEPDWLAELIGALDREPEASMAASKLLLFDRRDTLHSAGDYYGLDGVPGSRGVWQRDDGRYDRDRWVFGACGGAAAYRRSMLRDVGLFDEELVAYCEDVDLNLRARLAGHACVFAPRARVYHKLSATGGGPLASYYCGRNFLYVMAKDVPAPILRRHWRRMLGAQLRLALDAARHGREAAARARLRGQLAGLRLLPRALVRRRLVQPRARVSPAALERLMALADRPTADLAWSGR